MDNGIVVGQVKVLMEVNINDGYLPATNPRMKGKEVGRDNEVGEKPKNQLIVVWVRER